MCFGCVENFLEDLEVNFSLKNLTFYKHVEIQLVLKKVNFLSEKLSLESFKKFYASKAHHVVRTLFYMLVKNHDHNVTTREILLKT